ncbi:CpaF family protein [Helcococcus kunzii]|uniref:CpaF family protein n=1 Tax=Helcococcus kunzii TaxID=40091 RepID=UPI0024AE18E8|nr:CpaF family protein [Helcococcus kunzii]
MININEIKKGISPDEFVLLNDNQIFQRLNIIVLEYINEKSYKYNLDEIKQIVNDLYSEYRGLGILDKFLADDSINEIMINSYKEIYLEKDGKIIKSRYSFSDNDDYMRIIQKMVSESGREVNISNPIVDINLKDGSRVNIVLNPISKDNPVVTIRKFAEKTITLKQLIEFNTIDEKTAEFISDLVQSRYNIMIGGGTSSGKTTFLNALSEYISKDERIITIEDSRELKILDNDNWISLESRQPNSSNKGAITIKDLIKNSLRMRPDRIIVGEVRSDETLDMLQAMNTGHDGSLSTAHANSSKDMISRLETMVLRSSENIPIEAIKRMINSSIEIIIQLKRVSLSRRRVIEISEVLQDENGKTVINIIFKYDYKSDKLKKVGNLINEEKLLRRKNV